MKARGHKIDDKYIKQIKKDFSRRDKKNRHRAIRAKSAKSGDNDVEVPIPILVGVTVSLCGLFLVIAPFPICQTAGVWLINTGVGILGSDVIQRWDSYDKDKKINDREVVTLF